MSKKKYSQSADSEYSLVYSTDEGRACPDCHRPVRLCVCRKKRPSPPGDGTIRISRSTKGRKGKGVTVLSGVPHTGDALKEFGKKMKQLCGAGGTVKDGTVEVQGEHRDFLASELIKLGYRVKISGS
jgi:translation initiation factor 1